MLRWFAVIIVVTVLGLAGFTAWGCFALNRHLIQAVDEFGDEARSARTETSNLEGIETGLSTTLDEINRPCKGKGSDVNSCGLLASVKKVARDSGDAVITTQLQVKATTPLLVNAALAVKDAGGRINLTADAATAALQTAQLAIGQLNDPKAGLKPMLAAYTGVAVDVDELLKRKAVNRIVDNVAGMTESGNGILVDFRAMADKAKTDYTSTKPWYQKGLMYTGDVLDLASFLAHHP